MTEHPVTPTYRYRGHVEPSAAVSRPVVARRNTTAAAADGTPAATSATLDIFDVIDDMGGWWGISARDVDAALKQIGDVDTLYVRLNSPGGCASEGVAIANLLRAAKATVRATVYGIAASAASVIAIAADTVSMAPGSILMVHEASDITWGDADEMRKCASALDAVSAGYASLYALKGGGTADDWRTIMRAETWYTAEAAVTAKLADKVGLDPQLPTDLPPVEDDEADESVTVNVDVEVNPAARAAARRFDLSMFAHAPAALAVTQPPAEPPVVPPITPKEADAMSDELITGLRERFGFDEGADVSAILAAVDAAQDPEVTPETIAKAYGVTAEQATAALAGAKAGKETVSASYLATLEANAKLGAEARAKQLADERDEAIHAKVAAGIISRDQVESWQRDWDRDPASAKAELDKLTVARFPVGDAPGHGGDASIGDYTDEMAAQDAELFGLPKEAFAR